MNIFGLQNELSIHVNLLTPKALLGEIQAGCSTPLIRTHYAIQCKPYIVTFFPTQSGFILHID
jgi:hypothetical protein